MFSIILTPLSESATLERVQLSFLGDGACSDKYAACRENVLSSWKAVFEEDIFVVEGMQKGRRSSGFNGGVFTPLMDASTHHFHGWLAKRYQEAQAELGD
jgi:choline monooxygenase